MLRTVEQLREEAIRVHNLSCLTVGDDHDVECKKEIDAILSLILSARREVADAAVGAVPEKTTNYSELKSFTQQGRNHGWNAARTSLTDALAPVLGEKV